MAKKSTLPQVSLKAARLRLLLLLVPLLALELAAARGPSGLQFAAGLLVWLGLTVLSTAVTLGVAAALGGHVVWLTIGAGPRLDRRVVGRRVQVIRALPITVSGAFLTGGEDGGRNFRIINATGLLFPVALGAAAAAVLPARAVVAVGFLTFAALVLTSTVRDPYSGRTFAARVFQAPTVHTDPVLAGPGRELSSRIAVDVQFGDLDETRALLDQLRAIPGTERRAAELESEILAARGEYDAALRVAHPEPDPADSAELTSARGATRSARSAKLLMLLVEQDPTLAPKAVPLARRHLAAAAKARTGAGTERTGRVLLALHAGNLQAAKRENKVCAARARLPLEIADVLCNRAVIESRLGRSAKAAGSLAQAERFAPGYPRIAAVRRIAGAGAAAVLATLPAAAPGADTSHVFAEPWSVPQDGR